MNNNELADTARTLAIASFGFGTQFIQNMDVVIKLLIGLATLCYVVSKFGILMMKNWEIVRHPIQYLRRRKLEKSSKDEETT